MIKKIPSRLFSGLFVFALCFVLLTGVASAQYWTEDSSGDFIYPTDTTHGITIGHNNDYGHTLDVQSTRNVDNDFIFRGYTGLSGERDIFAIYDNDSQGGWQDESSVFKILRYRAFHDDADGASLAELTFQGNVPTVADRQFYMLGRGGATANEAEVSWGISANDSDFWTIGDIHGGATGIDCGGTGAACFNSPTYELSASGDSFINGGNLGIGTETPAEALDVQGNIQASGTICDSTGCIGSGSGGTSVWSTSGTDAYYDSGNVGIGTTSPLAALHVIDDEGALFYGTHGSGTGSSLGAGTRMMWYPKKSAFRAGYVGDTQWDDTNIGDYSVAMGAHTWATGEGSTSFGSGSQATGEYSTAMGYNSYATGNISTSLGNNNYATGNSSVALGENNTTSGYISSALGYNNTASGDYSIAGGSGSTASGNTSVALGNYNTASGDYSVAIGNGTASGQNSFVLGADVAASGDYSMVTGQKQIAESYNSFLTGRYGDGTGDSTSWVDTDPLFVIGNGTSSSALNNALTVYKDGNADLDGDFTATGQICDSTGCISSSGSSATGSLTSGYVPYYDGSNLVDTAMYYDSSLESLAIGTYNTATGGYSVATGWNATASGDKSVAFGSNADASGTYAMAIGSGATASGSSSVALGNGETTGQSSFAVGSGTLSEGTRTTAMGSGSEAIANYSTAIGRDNIANGNFSFAMGREVVADAYNSFVIGRYNDTDSSWSTSAWDTQDPVFIIGNGDSSTPSNAFVVLKDGTLEVDGDITSDGEICIGSGC